MKSKFISIYFFTIIILILIESVPLHTIRANQIQKGIDNFVLLDHRGKSHELYYYSDKKAIVLISQGNGCPIARHSIPSLNKLKNEFGPQNVIFFMINANPQDDRFSISEEAEEFKINIPILEDSSQTIAESLNIQRTAEAILINPADWSIVYHGAIDDRLGYEAQKKQAGHHYLKDAIESLLKGEKVKTPSTAVKGCLINYEKTNKALTYTYNQHVAPILQKKCLRCHYSGGVAPWAMNNYQTIKSWGPMIREVIRTKRMPPFNPDPYYGRFKNDFSLTPMEIHTIIHWIEQGFKRGEGDDYLSQIPRPKQIEWPLGEPDIILTVQKEQNIPATGLLPYRYIYADKEIDRHLWLRAAHVKPSNPKTVHHIETFVQPPEIINKGKPNEYKSQFLRPKEIQFKDGILLRRQDYGFTGFSPGYEPDFYPESTGLFLPKGSKIFFQLHYTTSGKPETDTTKLGLYLHKNKPANFYMAKPIRDHKFQIPPGVKEHQVSASEIFKDEVTLYSINPHMHYRGKSMKVTAKYPDGTFENLLSVPEFNFFWQHEYQLAEPKILPAGTRIDVSGAFDNSPQNPRNPDPSHKVEWGRLSVDEMFRCVVRYKEN